MDFTASENQSEIRVSRIHTILLNGGERPSSSDAGRLKRT
ncbi:hypothetical protein RISK_002728 [Rhodopirellula islandica]|uniref:Uncharacterized protein n=1 Tax=Rhodopirellula islandica TaxID=595434 RepID=A0A0J1BF97_RHOIS|nr:hypothetical protein RISK_002728 [Rhodopirellula islandica]